MTASAAKKAQDETWAAIAKARAAQDAARRAAKPKGKLPPAFKGAS